MNSPVQNIQMFGVCQILTLMWSVVPCKSVTAQEISWPAADWAVSTPEAEGIDGSVVDALVADFEAGKYGLMDHFLLIRHGRVGADHHFEQDYEAVMARFDTTRYQYNYDDTEWHPFYNGTHLHTMQPFTKSVTSAALGIAMDEGLIENVDVPASSFFGSYEYDLSDKRKRAITLEDLLTMRSGIKWNTVGGYSEATHSTIMMELSDAWIPFILRQPMYAEPGTTYQYNDGASVLIGKILRESTGQRIDTWVRERLFDPIGIDEFYWKITPEGEADTEGGLYLTPYDLARIGYLFLHDGNWNGEQIISADWVHRSMTSSPFSTDGIFMGAISSPRTEHCRIVFFQGCEISGVFEDAEMRTAICELLLRQKKPPGMSIILTTPRLTLRTLETEDALFIRTLFNEPSFLEHIGDRGIRTLSDAETYIMTGPMKSFRERGHGLHLVELTDEGVPIGICGLLKRDSLEDLDLGFAFLPSYWRRGFAHEASEAVLRNAHTKLGIDRVLAITSEKNEASISLLEKIGFAFENDIQIAPGESCVRLYKVDLR